MKLTRAAGGARMVDEADAADCLSFTSSADDIPLSKIVLAKIDIACSTCKLFPTVLIILRQGACKSDKL